MALPSTRSFLSSKHLGKPTLCDWRPVEFAPFVLLAYRTNDFSVATSYLNDITVAMPPEAMSLKAR